MSRIKLDSIDLKILKSLQEDGRITNVELAKYAGVSAPPCLRRVRALEETGYIDSYHANINMSKMGYTVTVFAFVSLKTQQETDLTAFAQVVDSWPLVRDSYMIAGDTDFILRIIAKDWEQYNKFLVNELLTAPNVLNVKSALGIRATKQRHGIPISEE